MLNCKFYAIVMLIHFPLIVSLPDFVSSKNLAVWSECTPRLCSPTPSTNRCSFQKKPPPMSYFPFSCPATTPLNRSNSSACTKFAPARNTNESSTRTTFRSKLSSNASKRTKSCTFWCAETRTIREDAKCWRRFPKPNTSSSDPARWHTTGFHYIRLPSRLAP